MDKNPELKIPPNVYKQNTETQQSFLLYFESMNALEKTAYNIAIEHLGSSFNVLKSNGYCEWKKKQK